MDDLKKFHCEMQTICEPTIALNFFKVAEVEANSAYLSKFKLHTPVAFTGKNCQLIRAKFEPGRSYELHSHPHEQMSVVISGAGA